MTALQARTVRAGLVKDTLHMTRKHRLRLSVGPLRLALASRGPADFVLVITLLTVAAVALGMS